MDDRPAWARRLAAEREARGWDKPRLIDALQAHAPRGSCTCATAPHETHAATSVRHIINRPPKSRTSKQSRTTVGALPYG